MCGIIGYAGPRLAAPILLDSLRRLEYRGYDSAGLAILDADGGVSAVKINHKVAELARQIERDGMPPGTVGIGHTRWATHGRPSVENAHPHQDCTGRIHLIHNGIIENFRELRTELEARGHEFMSDTDTEVVPHLIEDSYRGDLAAAVRAALRRIRGAYALVVLSDRHPDEVVAAKTASPLVVGVGEGEMFLASDAPAILEYTREVMFLEEGYDCSNPTQKILRRYNGRWPPKEFPDVKHLAPFVRTDLEHRGKIGVAETEVPEGAT